MCLRSYIYKKTTLEKWTLNNLKKSRTIFSDVTSHFSGFFKMISCYLPYSKTIRLHNCFLCLFNRLGYLATLYYTEWCPKSVKPLGLVPARQISPQFSETNTIYYTRDLSATYSYSCSNLAGSISVLLQLGRLSLTRLKLKNKTICKTKTKFGQQN